jgi:hypothetical protein
MVADPAGAAALIMPMTTRRAAVRRRPMAFIPISKAGLTEKIRPAAAGPEAKTFGF